MTDEPRRTPAYGIDAPAVPAGLTATGAVAAGASAWLLHRSARRFAAVAAGYGFFFLTSAALYMHTTLRGKHLVWKELLDGIDLQGNEVVVDLGCGRGAVLVRAAQRVPQGGVVGVDMWRGVDQSGNHPDATRANAEAAGVAERVELVTGDLTDLPLPGRSADVILSSLALHNIPSPELRATALREAVRVLRPGGYLVIVDFRHAPALPAYREVLSAAGMTQVSTRGLGWRFWYGGPWGAVGCLTARKPHPVE